MQHPDLDTHPNTPAHADTLVWARPGDARRPVLEHTVAAVFAGAHGATIHHFHDLLLGIASPDGELRGVIGASNAAERAPLFLETYLDLPVEHALAAATGRPVERSGVSEVGNLSVVRPGHGTWLVSVLAHYLLGLGRTWATFTAGATLRATLERNGARLHDLGPADGTRLGPALASWGTYYAGDPRVVALEVDAFCAALAEQSALRRRLGALWDAARNAGEVCRGRRASA